MKRTRAPSSRDARTAARYAPSLNDLSPRPPRSKTTPTSTAFGAGAVSTTFGRAKSNPTWVKSSRTTRINSLRMRD
jgi:hypothetical protein